LELCFGLGILSALIIFLFDDGQRNLFENRYLPEHWNASGQPLENYQAGNYSGQIFKNPTNQILKTI